MKTNIAILGSTGSIGKTTINIIKKNKKNYNICLLSTNKNTKEILKQANFFNVKNIIITDKENFNKFKNDQNNKKLNIYNNFDELNKIFKKKIDYIMSSISGIGGLDPTLKVIKFTNKIAIANKESIICGWNIINKIAKKNNTIIIPIDSEHFSIKTLLHNHSFSEIKKIYITASGGPFLNLPNNKFAKIKPSDAIKHPKWKMGKKISIDSATLMNKILELIEAVKIFSLPLNKFKIIVHPQSLVHAIVEFKNGLIKLLYHEPDMTIPISNALFDFKSNINNYTSTLKRKNIIENLVFKEVDKKKFPVIRLIPKLNNYFSTPIIINGANEIFVDQFLEKKISFNSIIQYLYLVLKDKNYKKYAIQRSNNLKNIYMIDKWSRATALKIIERKSK